MIFSRKSHGAPPVSLVTGAAGFIGMHVAAELLRRGHRVIGLDDLSSGFRENLSAEAEFIEGSITEAELLFSLFRQRRIDSVFHLAAYAAEGFSHFVRGHTYRQNILGSANLINAAAQSGTVRCFVFASSVAVYGNQPGPWTEDARPLPIDPYGISKHAVELDLQAAHAQFGLPSIIFRPHNVYGEGQNLADRHRNVVGIFMRQAIEENELPIFGDGLQTRAFTHVADVAPVIATAVDRPALYKGVFNIGADRSCTVLELAHKVGQALGARVRLRFLPARREAAHSCCSHERLRNLLENVSPPMELEDGLQRMASWARRVGVQPAPRAPLVEVAAHLPACWGDRANGAAWPDSTSNGSNGLHPDASLG